MFILKKVIFYYANKRFADIGVGIAMSFEVMPCILKLNNGSYSDLNVNRVYLSCSGEGTRKRTLTCQNLNKKWITRKVAMILLPKQAKLVSHVLCFLDDCIYGKNCYCLVYIRRFSQIYIYYYQHTGSREMSSTYFRILFYYKI